MRNRVTIWSLTLLMAATSFLAACGGDSAGDTTTTVAGGGETTTPATGDDTTTTTSGGTATTEPTEDQTTTTMAPEVAPPFFAANEDLGALAGVDSYRVRMEMSASGEAMGTYGALEGFVLDGAFVTDPAAQQVTVSIGGETLFEQIAVGDQAWIRAPGDDTWIATPAAGSPLQGLTSALFEPDFTGAEDSFEVVGTETVNGRETIHYRGDLTPLLLEGVLQGEDVPDLSTFDLDVWADPAGFVVKMDMVMEGSGFDQENPDATGRLEYHYEVYDLGAAITITPPV